MTPVVHFLYLFSPPLLHTHRDGRVPSDRQQQQQNSISSHNTEGMEAATDQNGDNSNKQEAVISSDGAEAAYYNPRWAGHLRHLRVSWTHGSRIHPITNPVHTTPATTTTTRPSGRNPDPRVEIEQVRDLTGTTR